MARQCKVLSKTIAARRFKPRAIRRTTFRGKHPSQSSDEFGRASGQLLSTRPADGSAQALGLVRSRITPISLDVFSPVAWSGCRCRCAITCHLLACRSRLWAVQPDQTGRHNSCSANGSAKRAQDMGPFLRLDLSSRGQISLPIATAVSDMRFEKPHSLSYHVRIRTSRPSITLVWSMWNTEECGSWLKSDDTSGSSV